MASFSSYDCLSNLDDLINHPRFRKSPTSAPPVPIILVHGFSGWGAPLLGSINYWGGVDDIPKMLMEKGHIVIVTSIAPLSSNWERACELYRELNYGKFLDYNAKDEDIENGFDLDISYGNYFKGDSTGPEKTETANRKRAILFADSTNKTGFQHWKWSRESKAHFICHSQGGTTVRLLLSLMARGDDRHLDYFPKPKEHPPERSDWAVSVTTIGTPHKGTTICDVVPKLLTASPKVRDTAIVLLGRLFATLAYKTPALQVYDLQLDHWGIGRYKDESFQEMRHRLEKPDGPVRKWALSEHHAFYDNSIEGVERLRLATAGPLPSVYYFTLSFHATVPFPTDYPNWAPEAANKFPLSLATFKEDFLRHLPFGGAIDWILEKGVWVIFKTSVDVGALSSWVVKEVAERLLAGFGYDLILPAPGKYLPRSDVIPLMLPTVYAIGGQELSPAEDEILRGLNLTAAEKATLGDSDDWYLNDGVVNTASMDGPLGVEVHKIARFLDEHLGTEGSNGRGRYWHFGVNDTMDHADEIGVWIQVNTRRSMRKMYQNLAELVSRLQAG